MYTAVLYLLLYSSFSWGSLGYTGLLCVAVQKRLKPTALEGEFPATKRKIAILELN